MANWLDLDWLVGRRFVADLRVLSIGEHAAGQPRDVPAKSEDDRAVRLLMHGDAFEISLGELRVLIQRGFLVEGDKP